MSQGVRRSSAIGIAATLMLLLATPASAATLKLGTNNDIKYDAIAGEDNAVTVTRSGANFVLTDAAAIVITPTAPCTAVANVGTCPAATITGIDVQLGDLDDSASFDDTVAVTNEVQLRGGAGNDELTAGNNSEAFIIGDDGNDIIAGGAAVDDLRGDAGNDTITGGARDDFIEPGVGVDIVDAGEGDDRISEGSSADGSDVFNGGPGSEDALDLRGRVNDVVVDLNGVADDGEVGEGDNFTNIERFDMGSGNDVFTGDSSRNTVLDEGGNDRFSGGGGNDLLFGGLGNDTLSGGDGNDVLFPSLDADQVDAGPGEDLIFPEFFDQSADSYAGGAGLDRLADEFGDEGGVLVRSLSIDLDGVADDGANPSLPGIPLDNVGADIENFSGGPGNDTLTGNDAANEIDGNDGNDTISGLAGPDALFGEDGDDTMDAGAGIDLLDSGAGADTLRSRDQDPDEVSCGSSVDTLLADSLDEFPATCDSFSLGALIAKPKVKLNEKGKGKITVACPIAEGIDCAVTIEIGKGKPIAKGKGTVASGQTEKVKVKLTKAGKEINANPIKAPATTTMTDAGGAKVSTFEDKVTLAR